jgi:hypothetical protein
VTISLAFTWTVAEKNVGTMAKSTTPEKFLPTISPPASCIQSDSSDSLSDPASGRRYKTFLPATDGGAQ